MPFVKKIKNYIVFIIGLVCSVCGEAQQIMQTQVLVIGGGTGGTAAGIQSARLGVATIIAEPSPWLGGMLSAAGVTATDGNHNLPSGLWGEFREKIYTVYGGVSKVSTGWVSNTQFEPYIADSIFKAMATAEKKLTVLYKWQFKKALKKGNTITGAIFTNEKNEKLQINAIITIDATELGDVMAAAKVPHHVGMEAGNTTGENLGVSAASNIVQDLTYVAILKDFGPKADCTIAKPLGYNPMEFDGACTNYYINKKLPAPTVDAQKMLDYGRLPNDKYMLNWPNNGNDTYINMVPMSAAERTAAANIAKQTTLRFVYFIQQQLGFKNLGLATDEFPSADRLALMPYHREGRRVEGLVRLTINEIAKPFTGLPLYRTGIAVGDYPIDHHHKKNLLAPQHLEFYPVPSYNIPLGALIPAATEGLIIAEKGISVSNVVNGTTRLQPCVMLTGQAAGTLAALCIKQQKNAAQVSVREVQKQLLNNKAYIMPYYDVKPSHPFFIAIQKIGATGILKGTGQSNAWANRTWFYPDSTIEATTFLKDFKEYKPLIFESKNKWITVNDLFEIIASQQSLGNNEAVEMKARLQKSWMVAGLKELDLNRNIKRFEAAVMIDKWIKPFDVGLVDHRGVFKN